MADVFTLWEHFGQVEGLKMAYIGDDNNVAASLITVTHDPVDVVAEADVVYTDVWTSMGQEEETRERLKVFPPYQLNSRLVTQAKPEAVVMHCLPARRGEEITDEVVADGPKSLLFPQAENRLHAQKAILALLLGK